MIRKAFTRGIRKWSEIAKHMPGKTGKQCRERWLNYLDNSARRGGWSEGEDAVLMKAYRLHGNKFAKITTLLPGRSEHAIRNRLQILCNKESSDRYSPIPFDTTELSPAVFTSPLAKMQQSESRTDMDEQTPLTMREMNDLANQFVQREVNRQKTVHGIEISNEEQEMMQRAFISGMEHTNNPLEYSGNHPSDMQWEFEQNEGESLDAIGFSFDNDPHFSSGTMDEIVVTGRSIMPPKSENQRESWEVENDVNLLGGESFDGLSLSMINMSLEESREEK